jgi:hypothetical protein
MPLHRPPWRRSASVSSDDARNASVGSECQIGVFLAESSVRWWCSIIEGRRAGPENCHRLAAVERPRCTRSAAGSADQPGEHSDTDDMQPKGAGAVGISSSRRVCVCARSKDSCPCPP